MKTRLETPTSENLVLFKDGGWILAIADIPNAIGKVELIPRDMVHLRQLF